MRDMRESYRGTRTPSLSGVFEAGPSWKNPRPHYSCPLPPDSSILGLTCDQFADRFGPSLRGKREAAVRAYTSLFRHGHADQPGIDADVPLIARLLREPSSEGDVLKFTQRIPAEGAERPGGTAATRPLTVETESVLIPMIGRTGAQSYTLCLSSQVGCAMGCTFCETAQMGLVRSLTAEQIVAQWFAAAHILNRRPKNIVFMGMGEPLDNLDEVIRAIAVLTDHRGAAHPMNKITVSTVGRLDGIARLAEQVRRPGWHRLNLAVSVNAPNDEIRSRIMPINRAMPMAALREALDQWPRYGGAKTCIEYVLIPGVNDAPEHARALAAWVRGLPACVNVIPYNPRRDSPWPAPEESRISDFLDWLVNAGAYAKRRRTKGRDMMGACGQLGSERIRRRKVVGV